MPANRTSKRFGITELALRLPVGVCGQRFGASAASERYTRITRYLLVNGRESRIAELAQLCGFDEESVANELFVVGGEDAFNL